MGRPATALIDRVPAHGLVEDLRRYSAFGTPTQVEHVDGIPYFINEFWTARQRQAHRIHEVSYRACFKPQLPAFFIERLSRPGEVVHDPFMGRGTTPVEAALHGRVPYGNDTNPLSRAFTEPRINPPGLAQIDARLTASPASSTRSCWPSTTRRCWRASRGCAPGCWSASRRAAATRWTAGSAWWRSTA